MGEALITRSGGGSGGSSGGSWKFKTEIFTSNGTFTVPYNVRNNEISVRIFGGGECGYSAVTLSWNGVAWHNTYSGRGGGGGWMNNAIFNNFIGGTAIPISIGKGGNYNWQNLYNIDNGSGGSSFFGSYLSANGASNQAAASGGGGSGMYIMTSGSITNYYNWGNGQRGNQFGAGGGANYGGETYIFVYNSAAVNDLQFDINNISYGGGGGGGSRGGNGGWYGGGGGSGSKDPSGYTTSGGFVWDFFQSMNNINSGLAGNGGANLVNAQNGTNTLGWTNVDFDFGHNEYVTGAGLAGNGYTAGGGGFGGCGGSNCGGGGGYGGNGGNNCGGGGGYGKGADGGDNGGGGGGYYAKGGNNCGGGGSYGAGGDGGKAGLYGGGGGGPNTWSRCTNSGNGIVGNGGDGICIIQYYIKE